MTFSVSREAGMGEMVSEAESLLDPDGYGAHYRELAVNLRSLDESPRSVVVTGAEEGAGCSSVCLGLGGALASTGLRVAILDCNFDSPRLHKMLEEPNFTGLTTALETSGEPEGCGYELIPGLLVIPTGPILENPARNLEAGDLAGLAEGLCEKRDIVLIDASRSRQVRESPAFSKDFDGVLLVVHASRTARDIAQEAADSLVEAGANLIGVVLNGHP